MPRRSAAEAMPAPEPQEEAEEPKKDASGEGQEAGEDMKEALASLKELGQTRGEAIEEEKREHIAAWEKEEAEEKEWDRKKAEADRDQERFKTAHEIIKAKKDLEGIPDMTDEAKFENPREEAAHQMEKGWAGREAGKMEAAKNKKAGEAGKKPWWKRLMDSLGE